MQAFVDELHKDLQQNLLWETYAMSYDIVLPRLDYYTDVVNRHIHGLSHGGIRRVLDVGAGTGSVTTALLRAGCHVTAVDVSRAMLERLRAKLAPDEFVRTEILLGDARDLSMLDDSSFDGVNILLALFDMSDPTAALKEAIRVLRRGGVMLITEPKRSFDIYKLLASVETSLREKGLYEKLEDHWKRVGRINKKIDPAKRGMRLFVEDIVQMLLENGFSYGIFRTLIMVIAPLSGRRKKPKGSDDANDLDGCVQAGVLRGRGGDQRTLSGRLSDP